LQRASEFDPFRLFRKSITADHLPVDDQAAPKRSSKAKRKKSKPRDPANYANPTPVAEVSKGSTTAKVFFKGHPDGARGESAKQDEIIITTDNGEQYSENVCCLFCGTQVD
jgi:hypothetical protein